MKLLGSNWLRQELTEIPQSDSYFLKYNMADSQYARRIARMFETGQYEFKYSVEAIENLLLISYVNVLTDPDAAILHTLASLPEIKDVVNAGRNLRNLEGERDLLAEVWGHTEKPESLKNCNAETPLSVALRDLNVYCHNVFRTNVADEIVVLLKINSPSPPQFLASEFCLSVQKLINDYDSSMRAWEEQRKSEEERSEETRQLLKQHYPDQGHYFDCRSKTPNADRSVPQLVLSPLIEKLPVAVVTEISPDSEALQQEHSVFKELDSLDLERPRDGVYECMTGVQCAKESMSVVTWMPNDDQRPSYPEVMAYIKQDMPECLRQPRSKKDAPPELEVSTVTLEGADDIIKDLETYLEFEDHESRVEDARSLIQTDGIDFTAYYKPWHSFDDEAWGIFFDAEKIDNYALFISSEFRKYKCDPRLAPAIAFGSVYAHELFHAKVESALSWIELNSSSSCHLKYEDAVYKKLFGLEDCLEEALANWHAHQWVTGYVEKLQIGENEKRIINDVHGRILDIGPPGYRHWKKGDDALTHRIFATQLITGESETKVDQKPKPANSILSSPFPYDFLNSDIPLKFIGTGQISKMVESHPSVINTVSLKEFKKALKHFGFVLQRARGKGSHQFWLDNQNRGFTLPGRDPVSLGVFRSFLQLVGITKQAYYSSIRPFL